LQEFVNENESIIENSVAEEIFCSFLERKEPKEL